MIARLPRHSHYKAAIDDDEQFAAIAAALPKPDDAPQARVPLTGYSDVVARLDNVFDAVSAVNETLIAVHTTQRSGMHRPNRAPRPETAIQRIEARQRVSRLDDIVDRMTGGR
ncbi:hypothetical protein [Amycolatopsis dendrobii]|uniref:Uncharacterized protein n=1 Tax=Amycolatopsis dendrobii TaxID=2760662 RepID=A0A7W3ZAB7_9PSEU|nr:hypothetical protein [Amycolatopsis dendrobii]MBB1153523.1 hypothetical protein [Amycolatopsis dendrobii]